MRKIVILFISFIIVTSFSGCIKNSIVIKKQNTPEKLTQTIIRKKTEMTIQSHLEEEVWNKIKLLYIDI